MECFQECLAHSRCSKLLVVVIITAPLSPNHHHHDRHHHRLYHSYSPTVRTLLIGYIRFMPNNSHLIQQLSIVHLPGWLTHPTPQSSLSSPSCCAPKSVPRSCSPLIAPLLLQPPLCPLKLPLHNHQPPLFPQPLFSHSLPLFVWTPALPWGYPFLEAKSCLCLLIPWMS